LIAGVLSPAQNQFRCCPLGEPYAFVRQTRVFDPIVRQFRTAASIHDGNLHLPQTTYHCIEENTKVNFVKAGGQFMRHAPDESDH
jgi:hypothetical protein